MRLSRDLWIGGNINRGPGKCSLVAIYLSMQQVPRLQGHLTGNPGTGSLVRVALAVLGPRSLRVAIIPFYFGASEI